MERIATVDWRRETIPTFFLEMKIWKKKFRKRYFGNLLFSNRTQIANRRLQNVRFDAANTTTKRLGSGISLRGILIFEGKPIWTKILLWRKLIFDGSHPATRDAPDYPRNVCKVCLACSSNFLLLKRISGAVICNYRHYLIFINFRFYFQNL